MDVNKASENKSRVGIDFLLKEYEECWAEVRHVDEYLDRTPRFFLIVVGAIAAIVGGILQLSAITYALVSIVGIGLIIVACIGFVASLTIPRYRIVRNMYLNAIYSINKYFADNAEEIKSYISLQIGGKFEGYRALLRVDFFRFLMMVFMNCGLMGAGLFAVQNTKSLVNKHCTLGWSVDAFQILILVVECIVFIALNIMMYFIIIKRYEPKD